ncbi:hypothetical protein [Streptomyces sp. NBC_01216]|uniref:hypothetical protein n=1 Tax=unclassified Streptomyces TaxID=2593676 RepID=UPI002E115E9B|nr:hypothetical protein OG393_10205 [Streptomyces sp. NBC_01216]
MFWFLLIAMVVVVAAVTLAVVGGGDSEVLPEVAPEQPTDPLPTTRRVGQADVEALRLPVTVRGYRMSDVDDVLGRLGAELAERDERIARLHAQLAVMTEERAGSTGATRAFGPTGADTGADGPTGGPTGPSPRKDEDR